MLISPSCDAIALRCKYFYTCILLWQVYKACTDWVRWDMEGRAQYLHALLNAVHIYALPPKFLKNQLLSCPILSKVNLQHRIHVLQRYLFQQRAAMFSQSSL